MKGVSYPVSIYKVVGRRKVAGNGSSRIHADRPHLKLDLDLDGMTPEARGEARVILTEAVDRLSAAEDGAS